MTTAEKIQKLPSIYARIKAAGKQAFIVTMADYDVVTVFETKYIDGSSNTFRVYNYAL